MTYRAFSALGSMNKAQTKERCRRAVCDVVSVSALIVYFLHFAVRAIRVGFRDDEMMNLWTYWHAGFLKSLWANVTFWTTFYRPAGALYYLPLYSFYGLNPRPYRITQIIILAFSIPIIYHLARSFSSSRMVAFLATMGLCYHAQMASLVFVGAFIYDVLCGFFYFSGLAYYIHIRESGSQLRPRQVFLFLLLYVFALNFKEMAVSLPLVVLVYEVLRQPPRADWREFFKWIRTSAVPVLLSGLITACYILGKSQGSHALIKSAPYHPHYSWTQFMDFNSRFVSQIFYRFPTNIISHTTLLCLWALVFLYALLRRDRMLRLMAFWIVVVPLPIAFLIPFRGGAALYLPFFGWTMILGKLASDVLAILSRLFGFIRQYVPWKTELGKGSETAFQAVGFLVVASSLAILTQWENQRLVSSRSLLLVGKNTSRVIRSLQLLDLHPAPGSTILLKVKNSPFQNKWHPSFIASLVWNDHSLRIWLKGVNDLKPRQLAEVDYVISLRKFRAKVIREPPIPRSDPDKREK
jgi:hypothetical protein